VYCVSGARSAQAQSFLQSMGFDNVHNLGSIRKYLSC
jgi:rhodanese-related sulfurtransferase